MKELVAVAHPIFATNPSALKQQALLFTQIAIPGLSNLLKTLNQVGDTQPICRNLEWLVKEGIVFEPCVGKNHKISTEEFNETRDLLRHDAEKVIESLFGFRVSELVDAPGDEKATAAAKQKLKLETLERAFLAAVEEPDSLVKRVMIMSASLTRLFSIQLRETDNLDAHAILPDDLAFAERDEHSRRHEALRITLASLPIPGDQISWEQIKEYRSDPDSQNKFLDLRDWISDIARGQLAPNDVEEKLEFLLSQYQRHLRLHRMKTDIGTLETVVVTGAEILGNLLSFQWGKVAQAVFSIKRRHIALMEGELTAPGSEVAYVMKARETFSDVH